MKILPIILFALLSSCSTNYYDFTKTGPTATVSFSNLSKELPEIYIIDNCSISKIDEKYIEDKFPSEKSAYKIKLPVERKITFEYRYFWVSGETTKLVTTGSVFNQKFENQKDMIVSMCKEKITFIPEVNKHYEIYFGKVTNECVIKVGEAHFSDKDKWISSVNIYDKPKC